MTRFTTCLCLAPGTLLREVSRSRRVISARTRWFPQDLQILPFVGNVFHISIDCIHHGPDDISPIGQGCQI